MRYRVTFVERTDSSGGPSEVPTDNVEIHAPAGVILDKAMVQRDEPLAMHNQESFEEDDSFMSVGSETWDYDVADGRDQEFLDALRRSRLALECVPLEEISNA